MGVIEKLTNKTVFLDTSPLIFYLEENQKYIKFLDQLFSANEKGQFFFHSSVITLLEVLVLPLRENALELTGKYKNILSNSPTIKLYDINIQVALEAAKLRADYGLKTPDSIQLATALYSGADFFLTKDTRLKVVKEIDFIIVEENI